MLIFEEKDDILKAAYINFITKIRKEIVNEERRNNIKKHKIRNTRSVK